MACYTEQKDKMHGYTVVGYTEEFIASQYTGL